MSFSEEADLNLSEQRLVELTDSEEAVGEKDAELLARLQLRATNKIKAALYGKYAVDESDPPEILVQIEADLWRYYLYEHRETMKVPEVVEKAYRMAIDLLEGYRTGTELLAASRVNAASDPAPSAGAFSSDSDARVFGRAKDSL